MFAILGAAGKAGYATATALRAAGKPVRAILRDPSKAERLATLADLHDTGALLRAFEGAAVVQVICPTAPRAQNAAGEMHHSIESVALALEVVMPEAVLAISDYGAEIEEGTGITLLFHALESRLRRLPSRLILLRSAEHMENWARVIGPAAETGVLPSLHHPLSKIFPTVSARDVGGIAADLLMESTSDHTSPRIVHAEGPRRYASSDVAQAGLGGPSPPQRRGL
jgi:NAD(P)H dehydrogenase (quinone)